MLKVWAYMGMTLDDRDSHRDAWQDVFKYETSSPFPSMASLDASMPVSWPSRYASSAASSGSPGDLSTAGGGRPATPSRRTHLSLGACLPRTPVGVHLRMQELLLPEASCPPPLLSSDCGTEEALVVAPTQPHQLSRMHFSMGTSTLTCHPIGIVWGFPRLAACES